MNDEPSILRVLAQKSYDSLPEEEKARCRADPEYAKRLGEKMGGVLPDWERALPSVRLRGRGGGKTASHSRLSDSG